MQTRTPRKLLSRAAVIAASVVAVGGMLALSAPALAAPAGTGANPYAPNYQHPYRHGAQPTIDGLAKMRAYQSAHPNAAVPQNSANNLVFRGGVDGIGVTIGAPKVYLVFWGNGWGTQGTDANGNLTFSADTYSGAPKLQMMFKGLGTGSELWSGTMTQYCEGVATGTQVCGTAGTHVGYPTGGAYAGVWYDNKAVATTTTGHDIAVEAVAAASHFGNTTAAQNRSVQYVILSPHNYHPDSWSSTAGWCAWHDWNGDTTLTGGAATSTVGDIAFTNMPYTMDLGTSCGMNFVNAGTAGQLDGYTMVEGHEYAETITDQNPAGGYTDSTGAENADKCAWLSTATQGGAANITMGNGTYTEQGSWSNDSLAGTGRCEITHAIVTGGGSTSPTVTNPGAQTGTVGTAASLTVSASGGTAPYTWSATGLPAGLTINSSTGAISGTPTTAATYSVTVTATDAAAASGSAVFSWTISPASTPGCTATNATPVAIPDLTTVESAITISGCAGNASATSTVAVNITHTYSGDLVVTLVAPDASLFVLQSRVGGATANIVTTYTVNLSTKVANGLWKLRVQDAAAGDIGTINTWTLGVGGGVVTNPTVTNPGAQTGTVGVAGSLTVAASGGTAPYTWSATGLPAGKTINATTGVISGTPTTAATYSVTVTATDTGARTGSATFNWVINPVATTCTGTNATPVAIPDLTTVESPITLAGCTGNASATSTVTVSITHTWIGDLVVTLVAPDGSLYVLQNRTGGSTHNINTTYTVNLSTEVRNGLWKLRVQDAAAGDTGTINSWTLTL